MHVQSRCKCSAPTRTTLDTYSTADTTILSNPTGLDHAMQAFFLCVGRRVLTLTIISGWCLKRLLEVIDMVIITPSKRRPSTTRRIYFCCSLLFCLAPLVHGEWPFASKKRFWGTMCMSDAPKIYRSCFFRAASSRTSKALLICQYISLGSCNWGLTIE